MYKFRTLFALSLFSVLAVAQNDVDPSDPLVAHFQMDSLVLRSSANDQKWNGFFKGKNLTAGIYLLGVGDEDRQQPHDTDEFYYIAKGKAKFRAGNDVQTVSQGSILFVKAQVPHKFYEIEDDLEIFVLFDK